MPLIQSVGDWRSCPYCGAGSPSRTRQCPRCRATFQIPAERASIPEPLSGERPLARSRLRSQFTLRHAMVIVAITAIILAFWKLTGDFWRGIYVLSRHPF